MGHSWRPLALDLQLRGYQGRLARYKVPRRKDVLHRTTVTFCCAQSDVWPARVLPGCSRAGAKT